MAHFDESHFSDGIPRCISNNQTVPTYHPAPSHQGPFDLVPQGYNYNDDENFESSSCWIRYKFGSAEALPATELSASKWLMYKPDCVLGTLRQAKQILTIDSQIQGAFHVLNQAMVDSFVVKTNHNFDGGVNIKKVYSIKKDKIIQHLETFYVGIHLVHGSLHRLCNDVTPPTDFLCDTEKNSTRMGQVTIARGLWQECMTFHNKLLQFRDLPTMLSSIGCDYQFPDFNCPKAFRVDYEVIDDWGDTQRKMPGMFWSNEEERWNHYREVFKTIPGTWIEVKCKGNQLLVSATINNKEVVADEAEIRSLFNQSRNWQ